jgi:tetratricopeptide (TPR) repeat protein
MDRLESSGAGSLRQRLHGTTCMSFRGAVLFVDISGYTTLAETLCNAGAEGVEQLGRMLDDAFSRYYRVMQDTGGEIECFAGDGFIACWPADDGNIPRALHRAHEAARALHVLSRAGGAGGLPSPQLHIGLSAGDIWAARLGSDDRSQLLLAGPAVRQACTAVTGSPPGSTVIAPDAGPFIASTPAETGMVSRPAATTSAPTPPATPAEHGSLRVREFVAEGFDKWIPQRRSICALFVRIDGLDERALDALSRHQAVCQALHGALAAFTSAPGALLLDDKGLVFTVCLGMPHDAHPDDAVRAVRASLAIRSNLSRLGVDCGIGIALGEAVCMLLGGLGLDHYWSVGRFMHIAGRLMQAAGNGVLCTEEVAERVGSVVSLAPMSPLHLKGVPFAVRARWVGEAIEVDHEAAGLYGRDKEKELIAERLAAFEDDHGTVMSIVGDAGIGKTTLVNYLRQQAEVRGLPVLAGGVASGERPVPYAVWRPVFAKLLHGIGDHADDGSPGGDDARRARLGSLRHPELAPLVNTVVPGFLDETPQTQALSGQARADATLLVLSDALRELFHGRFVLIIEDCHWIDAASWRLLLRIAQDHSHALIVLTWRPPGLPESAPLRTLTRFLEITLSPLSDNAIAQVVESTLQGRSASAELIEQTARRSNGNPLFAREYALLLAARGDTSPPVPPKSTTGDAPSDAMKNLIASRLDAVSPPEELVLKTASVIGDDFSVDLVARVANQDRHATQGYLQRLADRQLLACLSVERGRFAFHHALIREVAYGQLTGDLKRDLHRRVAATLAADHSADLRPLLATLAHHWAKAKTFPDETIKYSEQAAAQALAGGAFEEAKRLLEVCITLSASTPIDTVRRIRWHGQLADALHGMGHLEPRSDAAYEVLRLAEVSRSRSAIRRAEAVVRLARVALRSFDSVLVHGEDVTMEVARAFRHSAEFCYFNADGPGMFCDDAGAVFYSWPRPLSAVLVGAFAELGGVAALLLRPRWAGEWMLQRAVDKASAGDAAAQAYAHMIHGLYYVGLGQWTRAIESIDTCQRICEPMHDRVNWTNAQGVRFWMGHYRHLTDEAYVAACHLRDRANETGNRQHHAWAQRYLALCALRRNQPREAVAHLLEARERLSETSAVNENLATLGLLARAQLDIGAVAQAQKTAWDALPLIYDRNTTHKQVVQRPIGHATLEGYSALLTVALEAWEETPTRNWPGKIDDCFAALRKYCRAFPIGRPRYYLHRGDFQRRRKNFQEARLCYEQGARAAHALEMKWEEDRCSKALAEMAGTGSRPGAA